MRSSITAFRPLAIIFLCASLLAGPARSAEQQGLRASSDGLTWPRMSARLGLSISSATAEHPLGSAALLDPGLPRQPGQLASLNVLGDVYFPASHRFRATGGLVLGGRSRPWSGVGLLAAPPGSTLVLGRSAPMGEDLGGEADTFPSTVPYLGVGYSELATRGGWGFSADVGVLALAPRSAVRLGRVLSGQQTFDDMLRELRLTPTLQIGVSYSF